MDRKAGAALVLLCAGLLFGCSHELPDVTIRATIVDVFDAGAKAWMRGMLLGSSSGEFSEKNNTIALRWEWPDGTVALKDYTINQSELLYIRDMEYIDLKFHKDWGANEYWRIYLPWRDAAIETRLRNYHRMWGKK